MVIGVAGGWSILLGLVPILSDEALIMSGGLLFQWIPQVSGTLTKILNNVERLNEKVEKLEQPSGVSVSVRESDGEDIQ